MLQIERLIKNAKITLMKQLKSGFSRNNSVTVEETVYPLDIGSPLDLFHHRSSHFKYINENNIIHDEICECGIEKCKKRQSDEASVIRF